MKLVAKGVISKLFSLPRHLTATINGIHCGVACKSGRVRAEFGPKIMKNADLTNKRSSFFKQKACLKQLAILASLTQTPIVPKIMNLC